MTSSPTGTAQRIQAISAVADGAVLTTVVLYFNHVVGIPEATVGLVLAASAASAFALAAPLGRLADRVGLPRAAAGYALAGAAALAGYALAHTLWAYAAAAIAFGVARAGIAATIQAIAARASAPEQRVSVRARLHTVLNAGFGVGALIGAAVLAAGRPGWFVALYAGGALALAACAVLLGRIGVAAEPGPSPRRSRRGALRDRRLVAVTGLTAVLLLTMPILSVLLPLWLTNRTAAPAWVAAVAFGLNTVLVFVLQSPWSARVRTDADASRCALVAGAAIAVAGPLFALMPLGGPAAAAAMALTGVAVLTVAEVAAGTAAWHLALRDTPAARQGEYQAVFGMSGSVARILGALVALPLITALGAVGWAVVAAAMVTAATGLATVGMRAGRRTAHRAEHRPAVSRTRPGAGRARPRARARGRSAHRRAPECAGPG
ncbi:MFS transporter [Dactylosporangium vinaceum]|uniref:MFS transporter n=1 Tax=Dactylosporangium vinaceum TaxID=53362 RepID=A0ABV5ME72_9ACTN|nr:MFS transporter [Dactylosporangium vinaceum]UAB92496.1 MFS transporter [Dactylosporangium vinaceum]